jgi:hypothetical protein
MTGVFHFMAISLDTILARGKVGLRLSAVNQQRRAPNPPLLSTGGAALLWPRSMLWGVARGTEHRRPVRSGRLLQDHRLRHDSHDSIAQGTVAIAALGAEYRLGSIVPRMQRSSTKPIWRDTRSSSSSIQASVSLHLLGGIESAAGVAGACGVEAGSTGLSPIWGGMPKDQHRDQSGRIGSRRGSDRRCSPPRAWI